MGYLVFIGAAILFDMHMFLPFTILTMPPPFVHMAAVILGVIIVLVIMVAFGAAVATLSVRAIRPIRILFMLRLWSCIL